MNERVEFRIIKKVCEDLNVRCIPLNEDGWSLLIEGNDKKVFIFAGYMDINPAGAVAISCDKPISNKILSDAEIPVTKGEMLLNPRGRFHTHVSQSRLFENIGQFIESCDRVPIVAKRHNGGGGNKVFKCNNISDLESAMCHILSGSQVTHLWLEQFIPIKCEYRCVVVGDECLLVYKKSVLQVTGDGCKNYLELIQEAHKSRGLDNYVLNSIVKEVDDLTIVPELGQLMTPSWQFNLSKGAFAEVVTPPPMNISEIAIKAAKALNLTFCNVDVVETDNSEVKVLEVNSRPTFEKFVNDESREEQVQKIYSKFIKLALGIND